LSASEKKRDGGARSHSREGARVAAFFDVDGTLLSCQSGTLYIGFLRRQGLMDLSDQLRIYWAYLTYRLGVLNMRRLADVTSRWLEGREEREVIEHCRQWYASEVTNYFREFVVEKVREHREAGHDVALLTGGTGGAKLAHGFQQVLPAGSLDVIVNVGDDLELFGLHVSPDLDSVLYTLSGLVDRDRGWGVAGDTDRALTMLERYGEETWFWIGDADMATLVRRTAQLRRGASLTRVTADMAAALGVPSQILPATDQRLRTRILTDDGDLEFQRYFVERGQRDEVRGISFEGAASAPPTGTS